MGYLKPVALAGTDTDKDAQFLKQALGLEEPVEALCPLRLTRQDIFAELKSDKGKLTPHQEEWLALLNQCTSVEAYCWKPDQLEEIAGILRG